MSEHDDTIDDERLVEGDDSTSDDGYVPDLDEPEPDLDDDEVMEGPGPALPEPPHPINWNLLTAEEAEGAWLELNQWVNWLRHTYGLPPAVVPPFWYRHPELLWELSALHTHWLCAYDPEQNGSAPIGWHRDFADTRQRLRDWVAGCGTRLETDRPTRQTSWPGEEPAFAVEDVRIPDRDVDFVHFINADVARRRRVQDEVYAALAAETPANASRSSDD